jgi:hypothetical protein
MREMPRAGVGTKCTLLSAAEQKSPNAAFAHSGCRHGCALNDVLERTE